MSRKTQALRQERDKYRQLYLDLLQRHLALLQPTPQEQPPTRTLPQLWSDYAAHRAPQLTSTSARKQLQHAGQALLRHLQLATNRDLNQSLLMTLRANLASDGLRNSTTSLIIAQLRQFARHLHQQGLAPNPIPPLPPQRQAHDEPIFLSNAELTRLANLANLTPALQETRDAFLFCCLTGLRHSDCKALTTAHVDHDTLHLTTQKTGRPIRVDLCQAAANIIAPRLGRPPQQPLFHLGSVSHDARRVKTLARLANIDQPTPTNHYVGDQRHSLTRPKWQTLGTHTARRTFVALTLASGIPAEVVMRWTGHASLRAMQPYIGLSNETRKAHIARLDRAL